MTKHLACGLSILAAGALDLHAEPAVLRPPSWIVVSNSSAPAPAVAAPTNSLGPKIKFATQIADFGLAKCGEIVKYTYIFTNVGDQVLTLANVIAGCHCTTAGDWTRTVQPGSTGKIPVELQTVNFNGLVTKSITVACNDKSQPSVALLLKGTVWRPVDVIPPFLNMSVLADAQNASSVLTITNQTDEPVNLFPPQCNQRAVTTELKTNIPGKLYALTIRLVPPLSPGILQGQITIKTSLTNLSALYIPIWVNVQPPLLVMPQQIMLPQAPLAAKQVLSLSIQNFTTNSLVLSDPAVNAKDVGVQVREAVPGKNFNLLLTFPEGFEIAQGQHLEFSVKSSLPKFPLIKVPITQNPRPAQVSIPPPTVSPASPASSSARRMAPPVLPMPSRPATQ